MTGDGAREPAGFAARADEASPDSLSGQLAWIRAKLGALRWREPDNVLLATDVLKEEEIAVWMRFHPPSEHRHHDAVAEFGQGVLLRCPGLRRMAGIRAMWSMSVQSGRGVDAECGDGGEEHVCVARAAIEDNMGGIFTGWIRFRMRSCGSGRARDECAVADWAVGAQPWRRRRSSGCAGIRCGGESRTR